MPLSRAEKREILRPIAAALRAAMWRGIDQHWPELRSTAKRHPPHKIMAQSIGLNTFFISTVMNEQPKDFQVSTIVKFAKWVGEPVERVLGLDKDGGRR